jgi:hypothetical protein
MAMALESLWSSVQTHAAQVLGEVDNLEHPFLRPCFLERMQVESDAHEKNHQ